MMNIAYLLLTVPIFISTYLLAIITAWVYRRRKKQQLLKNYGIPGPEPSFFGGNLSEIKVTPTPSDAITRWLKQYGDVFGYYLGEVPYVVMKDPAMLKQVTITDFQSFANRPELFFQAEPLIHTVVALEGKKWKEVRSILTPTFSSGKIKQMSVIMNHKVDTTLEIVAEKASRDEMFDMYQVVQGLTLDVIASCALAMKVNCQKDPNDPFLTAVRSFILNINSKVLELSIYFPLIARFMTFFNNFVTAGKMTAMIVENVKEMIKMRRQNPNFGGVDLVQLMLDASVDKEETATGKKKSVSLTDDEIVANAYAFLLAGYETTSTALAFTFYLLIQHPEIQEKVYEEVKQKLPDGHCSFEDIQKLQYLDQVFNESLRMYPPLTGFTTRKCTQECTVGRFVIPEGVVVEMPVWDIHHDPDLWPDPWKFDPQRFAPENKSDIASMSFVPFGTGPRNCIGIRFAQLEAKLAISRLIQKYKFVPCEKTDNPLKLVCPSVIMNPSNGIFLRAISRERSRNS